MRDEFFYKKLKKFFRDRSITQQEIGDALETTQAYANLMLNGKCSLGRATAQKLSDAYGLSVAWLLTGEGNMLKAPTAGGHIVDSAVASGAGSTAVHATGGSTVTTSTPADTINRLLEQNSRLIEQNQKLIDRLSKKI
jgi:hypothetical protein